MLSGRRLNLIEPSPLDIEIADVALGLARNTRWNGQTSGDHAWSVAQHSVLVVEIVRRLLAPRRDTSLELAALLHDASEYVTHDLITPLKSVVGDVFKEVEDRLMVAVHMRFGLPRRLDLERKAIVKRADLIAGATEAVQLAGFQPTEVRTLLGIKEKPLPDVTLHPMPSREAERLFLDTYEALAARYALERR
ncbi:HD family hydrolase [Roseospira marina]|uniref:HD family hydrolase n=2 Tax=Roseospira marina TaxID=140057 RepID=A0A5M6I9U6_9PROT|nr:HD family hydrolase [Roseospira marina]